MNYTQARRMLRRAERNGYVPYHRGIVSSETDRGRTTYGINIDGDGHDGRLFGCPMIIWDYDQAMEFFANLHRCHSAWEFFANL